ncbi:MAG: hypothetical protein ACOYOT_04850 [Bacteroidales bacterium]
MAKQAGHIKYKGTIGDIRHFKIKGLNGHYAGLVGGPSKEQVKTDPAFKRTRENMNEFGGCANAAKSVRMGLSSLIKQMSDPQLAGRLTGIMKKINLEDMSEARGYRAILITTQRQYLNGLQFNKNLNFDSILGTPYSVTNSASRLKSTLTVDPFSPEVKMHAPAGATHFRLINVVSVISDFAFNANSGIYGPIEHQLNELSNISYSDYYYSLGGEVDVPIVLESSLPTTTVLNENVSVINSIGIEFTQKIGETHYRFNSGNAMKIHNVF